MQRQRGELVPIGDALADLDGPVKAIRDATPQSLHHYTRSDQVNQLVNAREADPDLGFMARLMTLCSLPRTNPGDQHQYKRQNGPYRLILSRTGEYKLPFGTQRCCMDRGGDGIRPFPSRSVRRCVRTQAVRVRSLCAELSGRP